MIPFVAAPEPPPWTDRGSFWVALLALIVSLVSTVVAIWSVRYAKISADAASRSADSSDTSARAAEKSADADGKVARVELERDHEAYRPRGVAFRARSNPRSGDDLVFAIVALPRTFRASGELVKRMENGESRSTLSFGPVVEGGRSAEVFLYAISEYVPLGADVYLQFWPPVEGDAGEPWTCGCGRSIDPEGAAHWELRVPVDLGTGYDSLGTVR